MTGTPLAAVVLAARADTAIQSALPKHLHPVLGRRTVDWVIAAARDVGADPVVAVVSPATASAFEEAAVEVCVQGEPRGTGDAVRCARAALDRRAENVLILPGDAPALSAMLLAQLVITHRRTRAAATVLSFFAEYPGQYGRVVRYGDGHVRAIVEASEASPDELLIDEVNASTYLFSADQLWPALDRLEPHDEDGALYLTDVIELLTEGGATVAAHVAPEPREVEPVDTLADLAAAADVLRARINRAHMLAGVTIVDPASTWIEPDVQLEPGVIVHPWVYLRGRTRVGGGAEILSHTVAVDAEVGRGAAVGPFCYLRPGTVPEAE